ncbi:MAG: GUN4 domain-containing protein [Oscillatoria sp. SIO1A7]|nr:GUN4 domain-containing protein [Oscillatoria sp. SIO1A7]
MSDNNSKVNYEKLQRLLADGEWEKADIETRTILLEIVKRRQWMRKQDIKKLPGLDLVTCDRLWFQYSKGHFGFGVQAKILAEQKNFEDFAQAIGWSVKNEIGGRGAWDSVDRIYRQEKTPYDLTAPKGHLPLTFKLGGGKSTSKPYTDDTDSDMGFSSIGGYYDKWSKNSFFGPKMVEFFLEYFCQNEDI